MSTSAANLGVVILAAGRGTRMRSDRAKVLHTIAGKPLVLWVLDAALELAPSRVVVVVGHEAEEVRAACERHMRTREDASGAATTQISYPVQVEQHGTGHAVRIAMPALADASGDVLILYGDVPALTATTIARLVARHRETGATLSLLTTTVADPAGYGRIRRDAAGNVEGIVEERDLASVAHGDRDIHEINPGIYCTSVAFLHSALARLTNENAQREYYLTDIVAAAVADGGRVTSVTVDDSEEVAGINSRGDLAALEARVRRALVGACMEAGVTFRDPASAYLEEGVTIGADSEVGPDVQLLGRTRIGRRCRIDGMALLRDVEVGDDVHLRLGTVATECRIGDGSVIGPFAHLRPGTELGPEVHIGNFVETKKARIGAGTKANHLTYLGDVEIGVHTNIGAGTITCNYDGFAKHRTVIGSRVQIGSDTQLVAPVTIADDAYVGAGTTVTRDVPPGHLVVSRVPQRQVPGWVSRRRAKARADARLTETKVAPLPTIKGTPAAAVAPRRRKKASPKAAAKTTRQSPRGRARATGARRGKR
jgi:bifunctional UDP-N-acetylglucosamine pyrophosphorylase / glucosamine-1-phosphate N-acetyltransferase